MLSPLLDPHSMADLSAQLTYELFGGLVAVSTHQAEHILSLELPENSQVHDRAEVLMMKRPVGHLSS
jgi:hypothetical protein